MQHDYNMPRVQTRCRAQDCKQNAASVKSCPWMSLCSCEMVWTIHQEQLITSVQLKHISWLLINGSSMDLQLSCLTGLSAPHWSPRSPTQTADTGLFLSCSRLTQGQHSQPGFSGALVGSTQWLHRVFGSRSLATNTTFPGHIAAVCAQPVTLTRAQQPQWLHSYLRARTAGDCAFYTQQPARSNADGFKAQTIML